MAAKPRQTAPLIATRHSPRLVRGNVVEVSDYRVYGQVAGTGLPLVPTGGLRRAPPSCVAVECLTKIAATLVPLFPFCSFYIKKQNKTIFIQILSCGSNKTATVTPTTTDRLEDSHFLPQSQMLKGHESQDRQTDFCWMLARWMLNVS